MGYRKKDEYVLAYQEGVKRIRQEGRIVLDRILNEALAEWSRESEAAKQRGDVLELVGNRQEIHDYFRRSARKALKR